MTFISNDAVARLREAVDLPDLGGTRYKIARRLGRGGMGTVYLVEDASLQRQVAMKVLDTAIESEEFSARLKREAQIVAMLEHPGIVPIHDVGVLPDGRLYYTMKYVQGNRLDEYITPAMSIAERLRLFQKICEPVAFAHSRRIIHRDLKPQNIMVGSFGEVLIMDWGVAKNLNDGVLLTTMPLEADPDNLTTMHGTVVGTPAYMSPEQQRGESASVDKRSDVYSLGVILYFLLTGAPPKQALDSPRRTHPKIARPLEAVCLKSLATDPAERYNSVLAFSTDVTHFLDGEPVSAYKETLVERIDRWIARNRFLVFLILAYLLMRILLLIAAGR